jgi:hypothetical protein
MKDRRGRRWIGQGDVDRATPLDTLLEWIDIGAAACAKPDHQPNLPPSGDRPTQRAWLAGFAAAWCEGALQASDDGAFEPSLSNALIQAVGADPALLVELLAISDHGERRRLH